MSLAIQLTAADEQFRQFAPESAQQIIYSAKSGFKDSFKPSSTIQVGDVLPEFRLSDAVGKDVSSSDLLAKGPLLLTFYRGEWCPFCNLALSAMQKRLDEFKAKGVTLVAISPELPDTALSMVEKHALKFPVLSDVGNKYAKQLGIVFVQPDSMRPFFSGHGVDFKARNGDDTLAVPVPATFLVDINGIVRNSFVDPDYTKRLEPSVAVEWIDAMNAADSKSK
jgi:peroxiredoxin